MISASISCGSIESCFCFDSSVFISFVIPLCVTSKFCNSSTFCTFPSWISRGFWNFSIKFSECSIAGNENFSFDGIHEFLEGIPGFSSAVDSSSSDQPNNRSVAGIAVGNSRFSWWKCWPLTMPSRTSRRMTFESRNHCGIFNVGMSLGFLTFLYALFIAEP